MTTIPRPAAAGLARALPDATGRTCAALHERLAARADATGMLDVAYRTVDTPVGTLLLAATPAGLVRVAYASEDHDAVLRHLADRISPRILNAPARLDDAARELDEYFGGPAAGFDLPLDWRLAAGFRRAVLQPPARHRLRPHRQLRRGRGRRRQPEGGPRRRHRLRHQPAAGRRALPPGDPLRRRASAATSAAPRPSAPCSPWRQRHEPPDHDQTTATQTPGPDRARRGPRDQPGRPGRRRRLGPTAPN